MMYRINVFKTLVLSVLICFTILALHPAFHRLAKYRETKLQSQQQREYKIPDPHINQNDVSKSIYLDAFNLSQTLQHLYVYNKQYPSSEGKHFECVQTSTIPKFTVCVFSAKDDLHVSSSLQGKGIWEIEETLLIQKALNTFPNALFIDVGANIGYYSLLARAMGRTVIAIEPTDATFLRLQEGVVRNKFYDNILMLKYAISDKRTRVVMSENKVNKGGIAVAREVNDTANISQSVEAIRMDDISNLIAAKEIIIKMDIEGYECKALQSSSELLHKFKVRYIFMEWQIMPRDKDKIDSPCPKANIMHIFASMYSKGFTPYSLESRELHVEESESWSVNDIYWKPADSPRLL